MSDQDLVPLVQRLAESVEGLAPQVDALVSELGEVAETTQRNRVWTWVLAGVVVAVVGLGSVGWWDNRADNRAQDRAELAAAKSACESIDDRNAKLRQMVHDGGIESGMRGGEALIAAVGDADPATVETYRQLLRTQLDAGLTEIVNQLPGKAWVNGRCVDIPVEGPTD